MDPAAMAGQPAAAQGGTMGLGLGALLVVYFTNNWKVVLAMREVLLRILGPFLGAAASSQARRAATSASAAAASARQARASRLAAKSK